MPKPIVYLMKDNSHLCCHCACDEALITAPGQMDCPWCGCGWLFTCMRCRKAFTFARAVFVEKTWEEIARKDVEGGGWSKPATAEDLQTWISSMQALLADVEVGQQYVWFDGCVVPTDVSGIEFEGWYSRHNLAFVPQVAAIDDRSVVEDLLSNREYWRLNELPRDDA